MRCELGTPPPSPGRGSEPATWALPLRPVLQRPVHAARCIGAADEPPVHRSSAAALAAGAVCRGNSSSRYAGQRLAAGHHLRQHQKPGTAGDASGMPGQRLFGAGVLGLRMKCPEPACRSSVSPPLS